VKERTMELHTHILKLEKELNVLNTIQEVNKALERLRTAIETYEAMGYDINNYKPFLDNYPFGVSFCEVGIDSNEDSKD
jgi:hypothetical protein